MKYFWGFGLFARQLKTFEGVTLLRQLMMDIFHNDRTFYRMENRFINQVTAECALHYEGRRPNGLLDEGWAAHLAPVLAATASFKDIVFVYGGMWKHSLNMVIHNTDVQH